MNVTISANTDDVIVALAFLGKEAPGALIRSLNRAGAAGRSTAIRALTADVGLDEKTIERSFFTRSASLEDPSYTLHLTARAIPAWDFGGVQDATGVSIRGGRVSIRSAFQATMRSGHVGFFKRTGRFGRRGNPRLERIDEVKLPITDVMDVGVVTDAVTSRVTREFPVIVDDEIEKLTVKVDLAA